MLKEVARVAKTAFQITIAQTQNNAYATDIADVLVLTQVTDYRAIKFLQKYHSSKTL